MGDTPKIMVSFSGVKFNKKGPNLAPQKETPHTIFITPGGTVRETCRSMGFQLKTTQKNPKIP